MMRVASLLPLWVLFATVAGSTYTPCDYCTDKASTSDLAAISLRLYDGNVDVYATALVGDAASLFDLMDTSKPTVIHISGWTWSPDSASVQAILEAYLTLDQHNILVVDYCSIAAQAWDYVVGSVNGVGYTVAAALDELVASGLDASTMHLIGHFLGAQVAGFVGRYVNFTLPRITRLDPAGSSFAETDEHLSSTDTTFVDVIHTNANILETGYSAATADFWPNGQSSVQPGCGSDDLFIAYGSSHVRSWAYFVESIIDRDAFVAIACDSYTAFEEGSCGSDSGIVMGYGTPITASGDYYLQTNSVSPYGKGTEGVMYAA